RLALARGQPRQALPELDRAVVALESLHAAAPDGVWEGALAREREEAYREAFEVALAHGLEGDPGALARAFLLAERARARSLVDRGPGRYAAHRDVVLSSPEQALEALPEDAVLIEYAVGRVAVHALVLDREGLRAHRLRTTREVLARALRALAFQMNAVSLG